MGTDAQQTTASAATPIPFLAADTTRNQVSLGIATAGSLVATLTWNAFSAISFSLVTVALVSFVFWILYSLSFLVLTHITLAGATHAQLMAWMTATTPASRVQRIVASLSGGGPSANAHWSILAMIAVAATWLTPGLLDSVLAKVLTFFVVGSAWIVTVYAYAVHYARLDAATPSLDFPGKHKPVFADYFYLSTQVATTFSSSDVSIVTVVGRKVVTGQTLIAFIFSTYVIAMLLALIFAAN